MKITKFAIAMVLTAVSMCAQTTTTYQASTGAYGQCASLSDCTNWQFVQSSPPPNGQPWGFATVTYNVFSPMWVQGTISVTGSATVTLNDGMGHNTTFSTEFTGTWTVVAANFGQMNGTLSVSWPADTTMEVPAGNFTHKFFSFIYRGGRNTRDQGGFLTVTTSGN